MKKIKGTHYCTVAKSEYPKLDELEKQINAQQERLDALIKKVKEMIAKK